MDNRTGIVMKIEKNIAYIMTATGEFAKIKIDKNKPLPTIGSEYCGLIIKNNFIKSNVLRYTTAACLAFIILLTSGGAYSYYKPVSTVTVSINPAIELKSNIWNKVIYVNPLNSDGKKITEEISLKNKMVDDALVSIINQAKKDKFIDENYNEMDKVITVNISGKEPKILSFENEIKKDDLNAKVYSNGSTILNNSSTKSADKIPTDNTSDKSSELNSQNNKDNKKINSNTIDNKQDENNIIQSNKSKDKNYNDKNSSKNDTQIKQDLKPENEEYDKDAKDKDKKNKLTDSNKKEKEEKKDK